MSEATPNLLRYAFDWNRHAKASMLLVHKTTVVAPLLSDPDSRRNLAKVAGDDALDQLRSLAGEIAPISHKLDYLVSNDSLLETLKKLLAEPKDNIILLGLKGSGILKQIFIGSVALEVIENIENTIAAIPAEMTVFSPKKLYVAVSDIMPFNVLSLKSFLEFTGNEVQQINFFTISKRRHLSSKIEKHLRQLTDFFGDQYYTNFTIYEGDNFFDTIKLVINNTIEELLVVQRGSRLITDQMFRKFMINDLVHEGQTPLIVLP